MKNYNYFVILDASGELFAFRKLKKALKFAAKMKSIGNSVTIEVFTESL